MTLDRLRALAPELAHRSDAELAMVLAAVERLAQFAVGAVGEGGGVEGRKRSGNELEVQSGEDQG